MKICEYLDILMNKLSIFSVYNKTCDDSQPLTYLSTFHKFSAIPIIDQLEKFILI